MSGNIMKNRVLDLMVLCKFNIIAKMLLLHILLIFKNGNYF